MLYVSVGEKWDVVKKQMRSQANLQVGDVELVVVGEIVGTCGGCRHGVPCLLTGFLPRCRDQPKLCHGLDSTGGAAEN